MNKFLSTLLTDHIKANQFASIMRFSITFLISILLVRFHLSDGEVAELEFVILLASTLSFFWTFAYMNGILSRLSKVAKEDINPNLKQIFLQLMVAGMLMAGIAILIIKSGFYDKLIPDSTMMYGIIGFFVFFMSSNFVAESIFILKKKAKAILTYWSVIYGIQLAIIVTGLWSEWNVTQFVLGYLIVQGLRFSVSFWLVGLPIKIDLDSQKQWLIYCLPLLAHFLLGSGMDYVDGHLVANFFAEEDFLYYRYGAKELPFSILLINAMSAAMIGVIANNPAAIKDLKTRVIKLLKLIVPLSIVFMFISPLLFTSIYGDSFITSALVFNVYLLIISSRILVPQILIYANDDNKILMYYSGIELVINVILSLVLLQLIGLVGIPIATVIAFIVNRVLCIRFCTRTYGINPNEYIPKKLYSISMLVLLVSFFSSYYLLF